MKESQREPLVRRHVISFQPVPLSVHEAQVELRVRVALVGRLVVPLGRPLGIRQDPFAPIVEKTEAVLRGGVALLRQRAPDFHGDRMVAPVIGEQAVLETGLRLRAQQQDKNGSEE